MKSLRHFQVHEFNRPDLMDPVFLDFLDEVRHRAGVPFRLTSDARDPAHNTEVGGSPYSLHLLGRAVDFVPKPWDREALFKVVEAVSLTRSDFGKELEIVQSNRDKHIHLGLFPDSRPSRLILALD